MARIRRIVAYHRGYDWSADNTSDSEAAWSRGIATVRASTRSTREVVKEDGEEDSGCPVYTEGRKAS